MLARDKHSSLLGQIVSGVSCKYGPKIVSSSLYNAQGAKLKCAVVASDGGHFKLVLVVIPALRIDVRLS